MAFDFQNTTNNNFLAGLLAVVYFFQPMKSSDIAHTISTSTNNRPTFQRRLFMKQ
jgi:hypothetical protein